MASILVVDDEAIICDFLGSLLGNEGHEVSGCQDGNSALSLLKKDPFDLIITDHRMEPMDGMQLLKLARQIQPTIPVVIISGYGKVSTVIDALKQGAFDFLAKPVGMEVMQDTVQRALKYKQLMAGHVVDGTGGVPSAYYLDLIIAESPAMKEICQKVQQVASVNTPVLISGPEGTGKAVVAEAIHRVGKRVEQPFHVVDCGAEDDQILNSKVFGEEGNAEYAGLMFTCTEGTLHLRNIDKSSSAFQMKLFKVLETREALPAGQQQAVAVDTRIITSSTTSLIKLVGLNRFRPELYTRLARVNINLKSLVERPEDILPLFLHILRSESNDPTRNFTLDEKARLVLQHHTWPGNGEEMESLAQQLVKKTTGDTIQVEALPPLMVSTVENSQQVDPDKARKAADALRGTVAKEFLKKKQGEYQNVLDRKSSQAPAPDPTA